MEPYYQDDHVTIYHGDCLDVLPHITADAVFADTVFVAIHWRPCREWREIA